MMVIGQRQRIIEETDGSTSQSQLDDVDGDDAVRDARNKLRQPSNEALAKFEDYCAYTLFFSHHAFAKCSLFFSNTIRKRRESRSGD